MKINWFKKEFQTFTRMGCCTVSTITTMRTCLRGTSQPVTDVSEVGQGGTQSDDSYCFPIQVKYRHLDVYGVGWCGVVWCGVVRSGVVWYGVV